MNLHTIIRLPKGVFEPYSDIQTNLLFFDTSSPTDGVWFYEHALPPERRDIRDPRYTKTFSIEFEHLLPILQWWRERVESSQSWFVSKEQIRAQDYSFDIRSPRSGNVDCAGTIMSTFQALEGRVSKAAYLIGDLRRSLVHMLDCKFVQKDFALGTFLRRVKEEADIRANKKYNQVTVKLYGKGVVRRSTLLGSEIKTRPQYFARTGQLIMSKIDARNGAFGIVPPELDGAVVTGDFPLFKIDVAVVHPAYLALLLNSHRFIEACKRASKGTTNRKRLREELFVQESLPIPPLHIQLAAVDTAVVIDSLSTSLRTLPDEVHSMLASFADTLMSDTGGQTEDGTLPVKKKQIEVFAANR
jgi:type I restriction enzyme M protein